MRLRRYSMRLYPALPLTLALLASAAPTQSIADEDPCAGFKWDVSKERALFSSVGTPLPAGKDGATAPQLKPNQLYQLRLLPAGQVSFTVTPGKASPAEGTYGGVFTLTTEASGTYRIAIDMPFWIDMASDGKLVPAVDYEGQHGCNAPRKIVEFALDAHQHWVLQLSGASQEAVRLTITRVSE